MINETLLRPEALPVDDGQLSQPQKRALATVENLLAAAQRDLGAPVKEQTYRPAWLDAQRKSRLVFIDGGRGTGKTTLLLTLFRRLCDAAAGVPGATCQDLDAKRIVLLEPMEMEQISESLHLLASILARISRAVDEEGSRWRHRRLLDDDPELNRRTHRIADFQARVARTMNGNLAQRRSQLDSEAFAQEVIELERDRLRFNADFQEILDDLAPAAETGAKSQRQRLFVLSVDDVDLNPQRCLELLQLLRSISSPQLFLLVLGDYKLTEFVVQQRTLREFAGERSPAFEGQVQQLAAANLRKLIPPAQRVTLRPISVEDALKFKPVLSGDAEIGPTH